MVPVLIGTYTRLPHLRQTISALQENYLAGQTDIYIASDFPRNSSDAKAVEELRQYVDTITGFASVNKIYREENFGVSRNFIDAANFILEKSNEIIILEDDIVTGRGFLDFMNEALCAYRNNSNVLAVSGYLWSELKFDGAAPVLLPAYNAWGWGTWRDRFNNVELGSGLSKEVFANKQFLHRVLFTNPNLLPMVLASAQGRLSAWDVDWNLNSIKHKKYCVFPPQSLVRNIGFDGTGLNCGVDSSFEKQAINIEGRVDFVFDSRFDFDSQRKVLFLGFGGWNNLIRVLLLLFASILPESITLRLRAFRESLRK